MNFYILDDTKDIQEYHVREHSQRNIQYKGKWCDAYEVDEILGDTDECPLCGRPVSLRKWEEPRKMRLSNTRYPDRLSYWLTGSFVVSERFKDAYIHANMTGISSFSEITVVKVAHKKENSPPPPKYYYAELVYSQSVRLDVKKSIAYGSKHDWSCPLCNPDGKTWDKVRHLALHTDKWDGTDIFKAYAVGILCSERFYAFCLENAFTNIPWTLVEEYKWGAEYFFGKG